MTSRSEIIAAIAESADLSRKDATAALDALIYEITKAVRSGEQVTITGWGSFKPRNRAARTGRNPRTGEAVKVKASRGVGFTAGTQLKADLNQK